MALRSGHGTGSGVPRVEVLPADELPAGEPMRAEQPNRANFDERGKFAEGNALARQGGKAHAGKSRLASRLSLADGSDVAPYRRAAVSFRRASCASLSANVGGGYCGPQASSMVATAALQLMWSRYYSDLAARTGDPEDVMRASRLGDSSRQNLLAAHELCANEAKSRAAGREPAAPLDAIRGRIGKP